jgi:predicted phage terminase large subunit-like protein
VTKQGGWTHLRLPAEAEENERFTAPISGRVFERQAGEVLWKARESQAALNSQKIAMGTQAYVGQYQQRPSPIEGGMFKRAWWRRLKILPRIHRIIWTWDTALTDKETSAYTSGVKIGEFDQGFVLMKFVRARLEYPDLKRKVKDCAAEQCHAVVIEDKSSGQILIQEFQRELRVPVIPSPAHKDKVTRAKLASPYVEAGRVYLMEDEPGAVDFVEECAAFPNGEFDDQVDSFSHGMAYLTQGPGKPASALSGANLISAPRPDWH